MLQGTARAAADLPAAWEAAGKTGTTDNLRDAWFAGYAGDQLAVVWVGRDDNAPMGLAGASGALPIWLDVMRTLGVHAIPRMLPDGMGMHWVDGSSGRAAGPECPGAIQLPFREGSGPVDPLPCALSDALPEDANGPSPVQQFQQWWRGWLGE
jgi:penicillin-binding protein 1B